MNLSSNFNRLSLNKLPVLKQTAKAETQTKEEPVVVQKQATKMPTAAAVTASALEAQGLENMTFISTAKTVESKAATKTQHMTEAEAKEQGYTIIKTAEDLANLSKLSGTKFILMNDIDLSGIEWKGIELKGKEFNGNGFAIKNLEGTQGLFSSTKDATIKNINIENANINSNFGAAILIGKAEGNLTLDNCNVKDSSAYTNGGAVGTLVGSIDPNGHDDGVVTINNCNVSNTTLDGGTRVGGFIGESSNDIVITNSSFDGTVKQGKNNKFSGVTYGEAAGGLLGAVNADVTIKDTSMNVDVQGGGYVGGIIGTFKGGNVNIENITGDIKTTSEGLSGGILGGTRLGDNNVKITGSLNLEMYDADGNLINDVNDYPKNPSSGSTGNSGLIAAKFTDKELTGYKVNPDYDKNSDSSHYILDQSYVDSHFDTSGLTITSPNKKKTDEIQYEFPDLIDTAQDKKDMEAAAKEQGLTASDCDGVYYKTIKTSRGNQKVYYSWNSNDKEFERLNDVKSINKDGSYVNSKGKSIDKPANEQIAARVGGYTPTVEEGTYYKDGKYYNFDEYANEFIEVDKSLYEVQKEEKSNDTPIIEVKPSDETITLKPGTATTINVKNPKIIGGRPLPSGLVRIQGSGLSGIAGIAAKRLYKTE